MQEGNLRCEPNVNLVYEDGAKTPIVEVKNVNSVGGVERAIRFEAKRQDQERREKGATAANTPRSTRGWDEDRGETVHQRYKESADDYRYFPEPDVPPLDVPTSLVERERSALPELPLPRRRRLVEALGLTAYDAGVLTADREVADWFEAALLGGGSAKAVAHLVTGEVFGRIPVGGSIRDVALPPARVGELALLVDRKVVSATAAKQVFRDLWTSHEPPQAIVDRLGLAQVSDEGVIRQACEAAIAAEPRAAADVAAGNDKALGRLVGHAMKALQGKGNPAVVNEVLRTLLRKG
jgi:aspartyl-tRNA(Asn)/glutamyl-tRNA(Gln) amidotransferase subunit B